LVKAANRLIFSPCFCLSYNTEIFGTLFLCSPEEGRDDEAGHCKNLLNMNRKIITMLIGLSMFLLMMGMQLVQ